MDNRDIADIVFTSPYFSGNGKALYLLLQETELALRTCWLAQSYEEYEILSSLDLPVAFWTTEHGHQNTWRMLQKAKLIIGSDTHFVLNNMDHFDKLTRDSVKLNLWHGSSWKNIGEQALLRHTVFDSFLTFDKFLNNSDYFLIQDPEDLGKMKEVLPNAKFIQAMEPKWISLLELEDRPRYIEVNSFEPISQTPATVENRNFRIIWAPTFREMSSAWIPQIIQDFLEKALEFGISVDIKPHHWDQFLPIILRSKDIPFIDPRADLYPLLRNYDAVVTDYSSLLVELPRMGIPCASYAFDISVYQHRHGFIPGVIDFEEILITDDLRELFSGILEFEYLLGTSVELKLIKQNWYKITTDLLN